MPSHPDRVRRNCPEMNCEHVFFFSGDSHKAPFIEPNGDRTTIRVCMNCGLHVKRTRTQAEFEAEVALSFDKMKKAMQGIKL